MENIFKSYLKGFIRGLLYTLTYFIIIYLSNATLNLISFTLYSALIFIFEQIIFLKKRMSEISKAILNLLNMNKIILDIESDHVTKTFINNYICAVNKYLNAIENNEPTEEYLKIIKEYEIYGKDNIKSK